VRRAFKGENVVTMKLGGVGATLSGCNTSEGFGKDVESVGEDIQDEAREAK
jgi:predicted small secreted protein